MTSDRWAFSRCASESETVLLVVETSSREGSVALVNEEGIQTLASLGEVRDHARALAPTVASLVGNDWEKIEGFGVSIGPGSFTGLRIGLAFLKGLAMVHARPAVAVSSLEGLAEGVKVTCPEPDGPILTVLDARRGEVFAAAFEADLTPVPWLPEGLHSAETVLERLKESGASSAWRVAGDGEAIVAPRWSTHATVVSVGPRADYVATRAWIHFKAGQTVDTLALTPAYHQLSAAEVNLEVQRGSEERGK